MSLLHEWCDIAFSGERDLSRSRKVSLILTVLANQMADLVVEATALVLGRQNTLDPA